MSTATHFFALSYPRSVRRYCGEWKDGDSWTVRLVDVTCPDCLRLLEEAERLTIRSSGDDSVRPEAGESMTGDSLS
jgi:hypothetical protein